MILKNVLPIRIPSAINPLHPVWKSTLFYYSPCLPIDAIASSLSVDTGRIMQISRPCVAALYVIISNGIRASEYLNATAEQVLPADRLVCFGAKRSGSFILHLPGLSSQIEPFRLASPGIGVSGVSYRQLYRACCKVGIALLVDGHRNLARTHAGRYRLVQQVLRYGTRVASDVLHHRSGASLSYYSGVKEVSHG
jgi:hypothetical protein